MEKKGRFDASSKTKCNKRVSKKWMLQPAAYGIDFLGMRLYGNVLLPGKRLKRSFYSTLSSYYTMTLRDSSYDKVHFYRSCLNAYLSQLVHCSGFILRKRAGYMLYNMFILYLLINKAFSKVDTFPINVFPLKLQNPTYYQAL